MDIDGYLQSGIDEFEEAVKARYATSEDADSVWRVAERVAQLVHEDVQLMAVKKEDPAWSEIRLMLGELDLGEELDYALQARLASHICPSFSDAATRCWELADLLRRAHPPETVQRFLDRVTRCYLLDFTPECLVMCRGALENAVNARYAVEGVDFPRNSYGQPTMRVRLVEAERRNWLPRSIAQALHSDVWMRGSTAAHGDPSAVGNALGAIKLTMAALETLNPPPLPE